MNIYRLNNVTLARGIGVDASLVSRWRGGERSPRAGSRAPDEIAAFLSGIGMLKYDREALESLLGVSCGTREQTRSALQAWLQGQTPPAHIDLGPESPELVSDIFAHLSGVFRDDARAPSGPVSLYAQVRKGTAANHELFKGHGGLRQAVINFMHIVLSNRVPGDLYIIPPASGAWIDGDAEFAARYANALRAAIQAGHSVHMVHPGQHGSALGPLLSTYMPLYATGRFFSYASSEESPSPAIFVLKNQAAVISYDYGGFESGESGRDGCDSMLFQGRADVATFEGLAYARMGRRLATACPGDAPLRPAELLIRLEDGPGALFTVRNTLDAVLLPEKLVYKLLAEQLTDGIDSRLDLLARRRESLFRRLETKPWSVLLPVSVIDAILINGACRLSGIELLAPRDVTLSGADLAACLENLLWLLERYPLLQILFEDDCPAVSLTVKEGSGTFFIADSAGASPSGVYVGDLTLCEALYRWFSARTRDTAKRRRQAAAQLREALGALGG